MEQEKVLIEVSKEQIPEFIDGALNNIELYKDFLKYSMIHYFHLYGNEAWEIYDDPKLIHEDEFMTIKVSV